MCSHRAHLWATSDFGPCSEALAIPKRQGLCSQRAHLWATFDCVASYKVLGTPLRGKGYVATLPTCGSLLILSPALKRWGPPRRQRLCSHAAHLWASSDYVPHFEALATPRRQGEGLYSHPAHLWATSDFVPRCEVLGTPKAAAVM